VIPNPWPAFDAVQAAYALPIRDPRITDIVIGSDLDGEQPYGAVYESLDMTTLVALHGTRTPIEWVEDICAWTVATDIGASAEGFWRLFSSMRLASGRPFSALGRCCLAGHSLGAVLAALWVAELGAESYVLFAAPKGIGANGMTHLAAIEGVIYANRGDLVPLLPPIYPSYPAARVVTLNPPHHGDLTYHHSLATYGAALELVTPRANAVSSDHSSH
jgi:hypothetical protein